jgi:hypothetical protein
MRETPSHYIMRHFRLFYSSHHNSRCKQSVACQQIDRLGLPLPRHWFPAIPCPRKPRTKTSRAFPTTHHQPYSRVRNFRMMQLSSLFHLEARILHSQPQLLASLHDFQIPIISTDKEPHPRSLSQIPHQASPHHGSSTTIFPTSSTLPPRL